MVGVVNVLKVPFGTQGVKCQIQLKHLQLQLRPQLLCSVRGKPAQIQETVAQTFALEAIAVQKTRITIA